MASTFRQDRGLWPSPSCPQETSGVVRAADVPYWLEHVKQIPPSIYTHRPHHPLLMLWPLSHVQVGANLGLRAADSKTITWEIFFSKGGVNTWLSERDYGWVPLFDCWVWSIVTEDSLEDQNDSLLQPLHLRHFLSHSGSSEVQNMNQWWAIQPCLVIGFFALVTVSPVVGTFSCCV